LLPELPELRSPDRHPAKGRSSITNNVRKLPCVNHRSADARRYRNLVDALLKDFPRVDGERLRELAMLKLRLEKNQASASLEDIVRLSNAIRRLERDLHPARDIKPSLCNACPADVNVLQFDLRRHS